MGRGTLIFIGRQQISVTHFTKKSIRDPVEVHGIKTLWTGLNGTETSPRGIYKDKLKK